MRTLNSFALALAGASMLTPIAASAADKSSKQPSVFLQCDGRTGHVSGGETFARLLLLTATAGISEAAMTGDNDRSRAKGEAGVAACNAAIEAEGDAYRRAQLGLARSIHWAEQEKWDEAIRAARDVPQLLPSNSADWALSRTTETAAANLEAQWLVRAGKLAEAEEAQSRAVIRAGADALAMQRSAHYLRLTRTMSPAKRSAYEAMLRYSPQFSSVIINGYADAGDYAAARKTMAAYYAVAKSMYKKPPSEAEDLALDGAFAAMAGDAATARPQIEKARAAFAKERAAGTVDGGYAATIDEQLSFAEAALAQAEGRVADARRLLGQRSLWGNVAPGMVVDLIERLMPGLPEAERVGIFGGDTKKLWNESVAARVAAVSEEKFTKRAWQSLVELVVDRHYAPMARQVASGSTAKPKWLLKPDKSDPLPFDVLSVDGRFWGPMINEPMMLHAALIAKARGKSGFVILPTRKELGMIGIKFVSPGDAGIGEPIIVDADRVIADLSSHLTPPPAAGGSN